MRKKREDRWLYIIKSQSPFIYKVLLSQFDELAISVLCDHYGLLKTKATLQNFLERSKVEQILELLNIEPHLIEELEKINVKEEDLIEFEIKREIERSVPKTLFGGLLIALAMLTTFGFFGVVLFLMITDIPTDNSQPLLILLGTLGSGWTMMLSYFFGGSLQNKQNQQEKPTIIQNQPFSDESINTAIERKLERKLNNYGNKNSTSS